MIHASSASVLETADRIARSLRDECMCLPREQKVATIFLATMPLLPMPEMRILP